jgi:Tfp pilus assembly protein PilP
MSFGSPTRVALLLAGLSVLTPSVTAAQKKGTVSAPAPAPGTPPVSPPAQPNAPAGAAGGAAAPLPPENYSYEADGRRDPFLNLLGQGAEPKPGKRAEGAAGLAVAEISVKGIVESRGALLAMIQGPDNKTYIVRKGDKFVDGTIRSVTAEGLIIVQDVTDPLSLVKQREIHKLLRSQEEGKE